MGSADVTNMVQAQIVKDQNVPVISLKGAVQVAGYIVVNLDCNRDTFLQYNRSTQFLHFPAKMTGFYNKKDELL